jgi:hypothetical protein
MPTLWFRATTEGNRLLPAVCPACLAPGVRALEVPSSGGAESVRTAYYCERCAELLDRRATLIVARLGAAALLGIGTATSLALALGGVRLGLQIVLTLLASLLPLVVRALTLRAPVGPALFHADGPASQSVWIAERRDFLDLLEAQTTRMPGPLVRPGFARELAPVLAALLWLSALHWLGRADLRVIQSGTSEAVVLIDERRRSTIAPAHGEHPHAARAVSTLAGRRRLGIVSERGEPLVDVVATLWPGRHYVLGHLPLGQCLFLERQEYGKTGAAHDLAQVRGQGPLWELPVTVDLWFSPLSERPSSRPSLDTSGGVRTAVRLLPCSGAR